MKSFREWCRQNVDLIFISLIASCCYFIVITKASPSCRFKPTFAIGLHLFKLVPFFYYVNTGKLLYKRTGTIYLLSVRILACSKAACEYLSRVVVKAALRRTGYIFTLLLAPATLCTVFAYTTFFMANYNLFGRLVDYVDPYF